MAYTKQNETNKYIVGKISILITFEFPIGDNRTEISNEEALKLLKIEQACISDSKKLKFFDNGTLELEID